MDQKVLILKILVWPSMDDDLGTPSAIATIFNLVHEINVVIQKQVFMRE